MTLNQLRYFCTASRCHSITKAAEELYVTQPTISMAIRDLEIEFGISLFSRKGNQLSLTQEGESFYKKATYILQYCNELQADYSSMSRVKPPLRIGIPPMLSTVFFPELLMAFHEKHPEIAAEVEEQEDAFVIHLKSSCFSPFTAIGFTDADVILEDNFFHMTGGEEMCIRIEKKDIRSDVSLDAAELTHQMEILTLA